MNKKGFTLVELLGTIVIIALVIGGSAVGIISLVKQSKDEGNKISISSIEKSASTYAKEKDNDEDYWIKMDRPDIEGEYFCVTIGTLQNKGLLSKDIDFKELSTEDNDISKSTYVGIKKDKITRVNGNPTLLTDTTSCTLADKTECPHEQLLYGVCTNNILNEDLNKPTVTIGTEYTDRINNITFQDVTEKNNLPIKINGRYYQYSDNDETINNKEKINISGNGFSLSNLVQKKPYYYRVCMTTEGGSISCSDIIKQNTEDVKKPTFSQNKNSITITYDTTNIFGHEENKPVATYYFETTKSADANINVYECEDVGNCSSTLTKKIEANKLYKSSSKVVTLSYPLSATDFNVDVEAWTYDESGNSNSEKSSFKVSATTYTIIYNANGGQNAPSKQIKKYNENISLSTSIPTYSNHDFIGWNTASNGTGTSYASGATYSANADVTLYAQWKANNYTLYYDDNGGRGCSSKTKTLTPGTKLGALCTPTRSGYWYFNGWYYEGNRYTANTTFNGDSDITLVASWYYDEPEPEPETNYSCIITGNPKCRKCPSTDNNKCPDVLGAYSMTGDGVEIGQKSGIWTYIISSSSGYGGCYVADVGGTPPYSCSGGSSSGGGGGSTSKSAYCSLPSKLTYFYGDSLAIGGMQVRNKNGVCEDANQEKYRNCFNPGLGTAFAGNYGNLQSDKTVTIKMSCSQIYSSFSFNITVKSCPSLGSSTECYKHSRYCMWDAGFCRPTSMTS